MDRADIRLRSCQAVALTAALQALAWAPTVQAQPQVDFHGCAHVLGPAPNPTCVLRAGGSLKLWLQAAEDVEIRSGEMAWNRDDATVVDGGLLFTILRPAGARFLTVQTMAAGTPFLWRLKLRSAAGSRQAERAVREALGPRLHNLDEVREELRWRLESTEDPALRGFLLSTLARFESRHGNAEIATVHFRRAIEEHRRWQNLSQEINDATLLFRELFYNLERFDEASLLLRQLPPPPIGDVNSQYLVAYYQGSLARRTGQVRQALHLLGKAADLARRFGQVSWRRSAEQLLALQLNSIGQYRRANDLMSGLLSEADSLAPCAKGRLFNAIAWQRLLAREAHHPADDPLPLLHQAIPLLGACDTSVVRLNAQLNLALAHWQQGDSLQANQHLDAAAQLTAKPKLRTLLWWRELQARIALSQKRVEDALKLYAEVESQALELSAPNAVWRALIGRARALKIAGRFEAALLAFAKAEIQLGEASRRVPIDADRERSAAVHRAGTKEFLDLLLELGRPEQAFSVARESRSRISRDLQAKARLATLPAKQQRLWTSRVLRYQAEMRALDEELAESWQIPSDRLEETRSQNAQRRARTRALLDEAFAIFDQGRPSRQGLAPVRPGELMLLFHPMDSGWIGFAADDSGLISRRLPALAKNSEPKLLSGELLAPFRTAIERHQHIRILPVGTLIDIDFHALPWNGEVLLTTHSVVYGYDLAPAPKPAKNHRAALLIADPTSSLAGSVKLEIPQVERLLSQGSAPWRVEILAGSKATAAAMTDRLGQVDLLHFAGHADILGRTDSHLLMAEESRLSLGEILTLPTVPATVVLSACEGARPETLNKLGSGLGLAQAFLLAGASSVVAAARPVDDLSTTSLIVEFYRRWQQGESPSEALRQAQLMRRLEGKNGDWASFRVIEP